MLIQANNFRKSVIRFNLLVRIKCCSFYHVALTYDVMSPTYPLHLYGVFLITKILRQIADFSGLVTACQVPESHNAFKNITSILNYWEISISLNR